MIDKAQRLKPNARILITPELLGQLLMVTPSVEPAQVYGVADKRRGMALMLKASGYASSAERELLETVELHVHDAMMPETDALELPVITPVFLRDVDGAVTLKEIQRPEKKDGGEGS